MWGRNRTACLCLWPLVAVFSALGYGDERDPPPPLLDTPESITQEWLSWRVLDFSDGNRIESVTLVLQKDGFLGVEGPVTFTTKIEDQASIALLTQGLQDIRIIKPLQWVNAASSNPKRGHLTLNMSDGNVCVEVRSKDFTFISDAADGRAVHARFYSPSLAVFLETFLEREGRLPSSGVKYDRLSGQHYVHANVAYQKKQLVALPGLGNGQIINKLNGGDPDNAAVRHGKALWQTVADYQYARPDSAWLAMDAGGVRELSVSIKDDDLLAELALGVMNEVITSPPRATDKPCESRPIGQLVLNQPDGYVEVEIHPTFFRLVTVPKEFLGPSKVFAFQSPSLAYLIDAIRASAGVPRFLDEQREALTGEAYIKARRAAMLDLIAKTPSLRREEAAPQELKRE